MALDFELSDEQKMIQDAVREMMGKYLSHRQEILKMMFQEKKFPQDLWQDFAHLGLTGCLVPEEYGGNNQGLLTLCLALEEISAQGFPPAILLLSAMDTTCILNNGSEELKKEFLPKIASGEIKLSWALTEPNAGSNAFRIETFAKKDGDEYVLNGQKVFITGVDITDFTLVVARTTSVEDLKAQGLPKTFGLSLFLVPTNAKGFKKQILPMHGIEGMNQFQLFFEDVRVPEKYRIGDENAGVMALFNSLNPERIMAGAICLGMTEFALQKACDYAKERSIFGKKPIGAYQAISHPLAKIKIDQEALRLIVYKAAWAFDQGWNPGKVGPFANMAKYLGAETAIQAADRAIQTLGGYGFSEEYEVIYLWESARLLRTAPISHEMILNFMAEHVLGLPRSY
ncbi:MAG: acyl-CoA dehydrogenase [Planctomycetota bacterium]|nr:MAG: acyl-CoA dehydrogenase [Planctomycetota bacterium]